MSLDRTDFSTFLLDGGLPFTDNLSEEIISQVLKAIDGLLYRIFSPLVTLWVFLGQVLSADPSCRAAVAPLWRSAGSGNLPYAGKGRSELGMLRTVWNIFLAGDIIPADRLMLLDGNGDAQATWR